MCEEWERAVIGISIFLRLPSINIGEVRRLIRAAATAAGGGGVAAATAAAAAVVSRGLYGVTQTSSIFTSQLSFLSSIEIDYFALCYPT